MHTCGGIEACHQQRRSHTFARYIGDGHDNVTVRQSDVVEIVTTHMLCCFVVVREFVIRMFGTLIREEPQLNLHREFQFPLHFPLAQQGMVQIRILDGQSALAGNVHQQIEIVLIET